MTANTRHSGLMEGEESRWVTLGRACEILGVDESTLRRWADAGRLRVYRTPGGHRRFSLGNLQELLSGDGGGRAQIGRMAFAKIRQELRRARQQEGGWYASLSESDRQRFRDLGRRLVEMVGEYMDKRTRQPRLLEEAHEIGLAYGRILIGAGLRLPNAVEAYIGFRKTMDETTRQASTREALPMEEALDACGQVHALGDQVLLGIAAAYELLATPGGKA
ncbi:MAG TPA: helix-turn-helix domain-containing protein [Dehalococcoidia bacterium]|nr:helix-turn-helix domain-containing protein [Dehalococcoidia bacterium]